MSDTPDVSVIVPMLNGDAPAISVIVPVLDGAETVGDMLAALKHQVGAPRNLEILVVDNGSTDGTQEIVRRFNVTLLTEATRGASAARNRGLNAARGDVVVFVDADTLPTRRWLAELVAPFANPGVVLVSGQTLDYMPNTASERFMAQLGTYKLEYSFFRQEFPYIPSCNMAVRREAALAVGGWDETLLTSEDMDFCVRVVRRYNSPILRLPNAVLFSRHRTTDEALRQQAWNYGAGHGQIHFRYPELVPLSAPRMVYVAWTLLVRRLKALVMGLGYRIGLTSAAHAEFATYHWFWSWWFWRGFFSMLRHKEWRAA